MAELKDVIPAEAMGKVQTFYNKASQVAELKAEIKALKEENEKLKKELTAATA
jgi:cell division protein FtsB